MDILKEFKKIYNKKDIEKNVLKILIAMGTLDILNIPSYFREKFGRGGLLVLFLIFLLIAIDTNILRLIKLEVCNYIDMYIIAFLIAILGYICILTLSILSFSKFKLKCIVCLCIVIFVVIISRVISLRKANQKQNKEDEKINVYDLKELYNGEINNKNGELIFVEESDVSYDLLNRDRIINELFNSINFCRNKTKFVISLTGEWGSGKSTILNIVKEKLDTKKFIVIDKFEIQAYNNDKSLIFAIIDEILKELGINFRTLRIKKIVDSCVSKLSAKTDIDLSSFFSDNQELEKLKIIINNYLEKANKRVVFFIDNFERTNENNILIMLNAISTILNIDRFIYVLSYDEKEMKSIFENKLKLNYDYMQKVIQAPFSVSPISRNDINNISKKCFENLFKCYGLNKKELDKYMPVIELFNEKIKDLRSLKRKINSICNSCFYGNNFLNRMDNLLIELINQENPKLYDEIIENEKYYISENQMDLIGYDKLTADEFNREATNYFINLFANDKNKKYSEIMCLLFPNVEKYKNSTADGVYGRTVNFRGEVNIDRETNYKSLVQRRIHNFRFFELYFSKQKNVFIEMDEKTKEFIDWNNKKDCCVEDKSSMLELTEELKKIIFMYGEKGQRFVLEAFNAHIYKIEKNKLSISICLINLHEYIDNTVLSFDDAQNRLRVICARLILNLKSTEIVKLIQFIDGNYKNIYSIRNILEKLELQNSGDNEKNIYGKLNKSYKKLIENVFEKDINIYNDNNYSLYNLNCLLGDNRCKNLMKFVKKETIFKFLADLTSIVENEKGFGYYIDDWIFRRLTTYEFIDSILVEVDKTKMTSIEKFIEEVYQKSKVKETINKQDMVIYRDEYIQIEKINIRLEKDNLNEW